MALVSNCTARSADVEERLDPSAIRSLATSTRGEMVGAMGEFLGIATRDGCGYWKSLAPGMAAAHMVLI